MMQKTEKKMKKLTDKIAKYYALKDKVVKENAHE